MLRDHSLLCRCNWLELEAPADVPGKFKGRGILRDTKLPFSGSSSSLSSEHLKRWLLSKGLFGIYGKVHRRKIGEGHVFFFFDEGRVIQLFLVYMGGSPNSCIHQNR